MTVDELRIITTRAAAICDATPYGDPKLGNGTWTVGFRQNREIAALQVSFLDRNIATDADLAKAEMELEKRMQTVILMST